jgi:hypothetical protein
MAKQTLQERFIRALQARGSRRVEARTQKYVVLTRPIREGTFYYVGRNGALRMGRIATRTMPCSEQFKAALLEKPHGA